MCEWGINHIATRPELISSFISCVRQSDWHTSCSETSALALQKERKRKQKRKNNAYKKKLQIFLWKLDFLFWSLYDSHFEVVWVFKLSVGSIFFGLWLFSLVLCCFFFLPHLSLFFSCPFFCLLVFDECLRVSQGKQRLPAEERGRRWKERQA